MAWWSRCVVLALLAGCTGWPPRPDAGSADAAIPTGCRLPFAGDPNLPPEMTLLVLGDRYVSQPLLDGGGLPLMFPPQGGRVAFAGLQARNVDPCQARLSGLVRDLASGQIRLETRTVNLRVFDGGYASSVDTNIATWANIPLCHNQWTPQNVYGNPFELELTFTDRGGRVLSQTALVTPYCAEAQHDAECRCICRGGYMLGEVCDTGDGGVSDGGDAG